jgi:hypothetical protein
MDDDTPATQLIRTELLHSKATNDISLIVFLFLLPVILITIPQGLREFPLNYTDLISKKQDVGTRDYPFCTGLARRELKEPYLYMKRKVRPFVAWLNCLSVKSPISGSGFLFTPLLSMVRTPRRTISPYNWF